MMLFEYVRLTRALLQVFRFGAAVVGKDRDELVGCGRLGSCAGRLLILRHLRSSRTAHPPVTAAAGAGVAFVAAGEPGEGAGFFDHQAAPVALHLHAPLHDQRALSEDLCEALVDRRVDDALDKAGLVFQRNERYPTSGPWALP